MRVGHQSPVTFRLFAFRFTFEALDPVVFPPGAAGNAFRGAFGHIFRRIACVPECASVATCPIREQCAYARMFEPVCTGGPSGLADAPRPFVMRAWNLDGKSYQPGESFCIDVHIFDLQAPAAEYFERAFQQLAENGIGANRRRIRLLQVCGLDAQRRATEAREPIALSLDHLPSADPQFLSLRFLTPTELKSDGEIVREPPFQVVLARARDRIATLSSLYGGGPLELDFRGMSERAAAVRTVSSNLRWESGQRKSSRTHQVHPLDGFIGEVTYQGRISEFLPFLEAAYWTGIGRQTVWGKGTVLTEPRPGI
jgi:hypothetical protein